MSNEKWLEKLNKWNSNSKVKNNNIDNRIQCEGFEVGEKGQCKHYMGCPIISRTCVEECDCSNKR